MTPTAELSRRPPPSSKTVSDQMKKMPRSDTTVEIALRRELHRLGLRYRVNLRGLPGTPDIAFTRTKIAVFVDGCFWHRCPDHGVMPKSNTDWWKKKLDGNVERDGRKDRELESMGWLPVHVWEHEDPALAAKRIFRKWKSRLPDRNNRFLRGNQNFFC